ncbi:hypothetical protein AY599_06680 [Leptolyngbya valderiana BDU 20041]|nr:hypothetical protein AY599_06680 [Leptolyngbya valderiana BDU 20041]
MPPGPHPTPRDSQRLTVRFLHAALDVEHDGDVVTMYDSAQRHPGVRRRSMLWLAWTLFAIAILCVVALLLGGGSRLLWALGIAGASLATMLGVALITLSRLPQARMLRVDLQNAHAELRWADTELVRWVGDVDGLALTVRPFRATTPMGKGTVASGFATIATLEGRRVTPHEIARDHGLFTATVLDIFAGIARGAIAKTNRGWIVLATGEDPNLLEAELREALPTLTSVIKPQRIDDVLTGPVDAKLLRKPTPRGGA